MKLIVKPIDNEPIGIPVTQLRPGDHFTVIPGDDVVVVRTTGELGTLGSAIQLSNFQLWTISKGATCYRVVDNPENPKITGKDLQQGDLFRYGDGNGGDNSVYLATNETVPNGTFEGQRRVVRLWDSGFGSGFVHYVLENRPIIKLKIVSIES